MQRAWVVDRHGHLVDIVGEEMEDGSFKAEGGWRRFRAGKWYRSEVEGLRAQIARCESQIRGLERLRSELSAQLQVLEG